jgi:hypothetical protein
MLSPFVALALAYMGSKRWLVFTRAMLYFVKLIITVGSMYLRECCFDAPGLEACPPFLVVPLAALHV